MADLQYENVGGTYVQCGGTQKVLDPGFYECVDLGFRYGLKRRDPASDELIDIPGTIADDIYADIDSFLATQAMYELYGLTHKRGYFFYGPPGTGKTSLGVMLGRRFTAKANGIVVWAGGSDTFGAAVDILSAVEPGRPVMYLIEECEYIVNNHRCLSILDGELSVKASVFVAMTNYKDKLPPRITNRPGRFDRVEKVDHPPAAVQLEYLRRVEQRGGMNPDAPERIVEALRGISISLAHLREAFVAHVLMGVPLEKVRERFTAMAADPTLQISSADDDDDILKFSSAD